VSERGKAAQKRQGGGEIVGTDREIVGAKGKCVGAGGKMAECAGKEQNICWRWRMMTRYVTVPPSYGQALEGRCRTEVEGMR